MTTTFRTDWIKQAIDLALEMYRPMLDADVTLSGISIEVKFDRRTGAPTRTILFPVAERLYPSLRGNT